MSGALLATIGATAPSGSSTAQPSALSWENLFGQGAAETQSLTVGGITGGPAQFTASNSGLASLYYTLNGNTRLYAGAFNVSNGDTLSWTVLTFSTGRISGTVTVKCAGGTVTVDTFNYVLVGNNL